MTEYELCDMADTVAASIAKDSTTNSKNSSNSKDSKDRKDSGKVAICKGPKFYKLKNPRDTVSNILIAFI